MATCLGGGGGRLMASFRSCQASSLPSRQPSNRQVRRIKHTARAGPKSDMAHRVDRVESGTKCMRCEVRWMMISPTRRHQDWRYHRHLSSDYLVDWGTKWRVIVFVYVRSRSDRVLIGVVQP